MVTNIEGVFCLLSGAQNYRLCIQFNNYFSFFRTNTRSHSLTPHGKHYRINDFFVCFPVLWNSFPFTIVSSYNSAESKLHFFFK